MLDFKGGLRRPNQSAMNTPSKEMYDSDFHQQQRQKYERSEHSYIASNGNIPTNYNYDRSQVRDNRQIYDDNIPVKVKSYERDDYSTYLRMQIFLTQEKSGSLLRLNLTDDANHLFLWSFILKESDYMSLRNEQKIKVDFGGFPEMLVQHFGFLESEKESQGSNQTFFYCIFDIRKGGEATLTILQSNKFKESSHLALRFKMATDQQIKSYLADKLSKEKSMNENLRIENSKLDNDLKTREVELESMSSKMKQLTESRNKQLEVLSLNEQKKLQDFREKVIQKQAQLAKDYESEKRTTAQKYQQTIKQLIDKVDHYQGYYEQHKEKIIQLEGKQRELLSKFTLSQKENTQIREQLESARLEIKRVEAEIHNQQRANLDLTHKLNNSNVQLADKLAIIESNQEMKKNANSQVQALEKLAEQQKRKAQKLQIELNKAKDELTKAVGIIDELKQKNQAKKDKLNMSKQIIKSQEKNVLELQRAVSDAKKRDIDQKREQEILQAKCRDLEERSALLKKNIQDAQKTIQNNSELINHLNRQLNQRTSGFRPTAATYHPNLLSASTVPHSIGRYPLGGQLQTTATNYQATSRLRGSTSPLSTSPLERTDRVQPQVKKYVPRQTQLPSQMASRLNQQKDPEEYTPTLPTETSGTIKPVRFKGQQQ